MVNKYYSVFTENVCHNPDRKRHHDRKNNDSVFLLNSRGLSLHIVSVRSEKKIESAKVVLSNQFRHLKEL